MKRNLINQQVAPLNAEDVVEMVIALDVKEMERRYYKGPWSLADVVVGLEFVPVAGAVVG